MPDKADNTVSTVKYRCVCGEDAVVHVVDGGRCENCGRDISAEMLRSNVSQTIEIDGSGSVGSAARSGSGGLTLDPADDLAGETLGYFQIIEALGHGGMGSVYRALDESLQRYVALKVIKKANTSSADLDHLLQEARAQARVNHPNVVHIYYVSRGEERPFLAMELVNGPTLAQRTRKEKLAYAEVLRIAIETTMALQQSARFDIVHGDIKPGNILLADGKRVKLSDFGLSRRISDGSDKPTTISGTPAYMAPEVTRGKEPSVLSDQYSLGVMLFQLTFGRPPYSIQQDSVTAMMEAHQQSTVEFPKPWPKDLPEQWKHVLAKLLAKSPEQRFANYDAVLEALRRARPLNLPKAGLIVRGMAWTGDLVMTLGVFGILQQLLSLNAVENFVENRPLLKALSLLLVFLVPAAFALVQARWRTSPGKKLLQIRIVDEHGLQPSAPILALRSVFQLLPVWAACFIWIIDRYNGPAQPISNVFSIAYGIFLVVSVGMVIFSKQKRALHDVLLGTRVCLDAGSTEVHA